jgi:hypothetical protein
MEGRRIGSCTASERRFQCRDAMHKLSWISAVISASLNFLPAAAVLLHVGSTRNCGRDHQPADLKGARP